MHHRDTEATEKKRDRRFALQMIKSSSVSPVSSVSLW